jgi:hypothetical protein
MKIGQYLFCLAIVTFQVSSVIAQPDSFEFVPTNVSGTMLGTVTIDGHPASGADWIAAFDTTGLCVGAAQLTIFESVSYLALPIYGDDTSTDEREGLIAGSPFTLHLFHAESGDILPYQLQGTVNLFFEWTPNNGAPIPAYSNPNELYNFNTLAPLTYSFESIPVSCSGLSDGAINLSAEGGAAPYTFNWSNGMTDAFVEGLPAGEYHCTLSDATGSFVEIGPLIVESPTPLSIEPGTMTTPSCFSSSDGQLVATGSGGTPPYQYQWSNNTTDSIAQNLSAGTHTLTLTDQNNCTITQVFNLEAPPALMANLTSTPSDPLAAGNGTATVEALGGTPPYTFQWNDPQAQESATATGLMPGWYEVIVTDANNCQLTEAIQVGIISNITLPEATEFNIFPNPATDLVTILPPHQAGLLSVFSLTGQRLLDLKFFHSQPLQFSTASLPRGLVKLVFMTEDGQKLDMPLLLH